MTDNADAYSTALLNILWDKDPRRAFLSLARLFVEADPVERALIRSAWDFGKEWDIPRIREESDRLVFGPVADNTSEVLPTAILVHLILRGPEDDAREDIAHIGLIYHCALETDVDPEALFGQVAVVAGEPFSSYLNDFLRRPPTERSLWSMGYRKRRVGVDVEFEWFGDDPHYAMSAPTRLDRFGAELEI